jgi:hypothetical protein
VKHKPCIGTNNREYKSRPELEPATELSEYVFVNNGIKAKRIKREKLRDFLGSGWLRGRLKRDLPPT